MSVNTCEQNFKTFPLLKTLDFGVLKSFSLFHVYLLQLLFFLNNINTKKEIG